MLRPHICYNLVLKTVLARQLYGVTMQMSNGIAALTSQAQYRLPENQAKRVMATCFEIVANIREHLEAEQEQLTKQNVRAVTVFPVMLKKQLTFIYPNAVAAVKNLSSLDNLVQQWYDQWFLQEIDDSAFKVKLATWRDKLRLAGVQVNKLVMSFPPNKRKSVLPDG